MQQFDCICGQFSIRSCVDMYSTCTCMYEKFCHSKLHKVKGREYSVYYNVKLQSGY